MENPALISYLSTMDAVTLALNNAIEECTKEFGNLVIPKQILKREPDDPVFVGGEINLDQYIVSTTHTIDQWQSEFQDAKRKLQLYIQEVSVELLNSTRYYRDQVEPHVKVVNSLNFKIKNYKKFLAHCQGDAKITKQINDSVEEAKAKRECALCEWRKFYSEYQKVSTRIIELGNISSKCGFSRQFPETIVNTPVATIATIARPPPEDYHSLATIPDPTQISGFQTFRKL